MWKLISAFIVPGKPFGKQRPRHMRNGHTYTPKETIEYENLVKLFYSQSEHPKEPTDKPIQMVIQADFPIPTSWSKKKKREAEEYQPFCCTKPDSDNIIKGLSDALLGIAYKDDSQIVTLHCEKFYGTTPQVIVNLYEWVEES